MTLDTLARRVRSATRLMLAQKQVIDEQREVIRQQRELIDTLIRTGAETLNRVSLEHLLELEGIVAAWLIHCDMPESDVREELAALISRVSDQRASLEEHVV